MTQIVGFNFPQGATYKACTKKRIGEGGALLRLGGWEFFTPTLGDSSLIIPGNITLLEAAKIANEWFERRGHLKTKI